MNQMHKDKEEMTIKVVEIEVTAEDHLQTEVFNLFRNRVVRAEDLL